MPTIGIDEKHCKGCALCVAFCPKGAIAMAAVRLSGRGINPVEVVDAAKCTGCLSCAVVCPDAAITIEVESKAPAAGTAKPVKPAGPAKAAKPTR